MLIKVPMFLKEINWLFMIKKKQTDLNNNVNFTHKSARISCDFQDPPHVRPIKDKFTQEITLLTFDI